MDIEIFSLSLNEFRKNLTANLDRSPLIEEPLSKSYGDPWLSARFGIKARLRRHAVVCQEVAPKVGALATPSPDCDESPVGRALKHASADDRSTLFAIFTLSFVPFMQYTG